MTATPIEPTRVALAREAMIAPAPAAPRKPPPPPPPAAPPWWASAPPPPPGPQQEILVRVEVQYPVQPELVHLPEPHFQWHRLYDWARWRHGAGITTALIPLFGGQSMATGWGTELRECRAQASVGGSWTLGLITLGVSVLISRWRPRWYAYALVTTTLFGLAAQASPFDLVTLVTGVTR